MLGSVNLRNQSLSVAPSPLHTASTTLSSAARTFARGLLGARQQRRNQKEGGILHVLIVRVVDHGAGETGDRLDVLEESLHNKTVQRKRQ